MLNVLAPFANTFYKNIALVFAYVATVLNFKNAIKLYLM